MSLRETPSQTAGPYVHIGCTPHVTGITSIYDEDLGVSPIRDGAKGEVITINGRILDSNGDPVGDGMIETWQADAAGLYHGQPGADPAVAGWCRIATDNDTGGFQLTTVKPGPSPGSDGGSQSPHIALWIVARGLNQALQTRLYFGDEDNSTDPVLSQIDPARRDTLVTKPDSAGTHRFNILLQGDGETVFFDM